MYVKMISLVLYIFCGVFQLSAISPDELLDRFDAVVEDTRAYQCRVMAWSVLDSTLESRIANVYYKAPRHVRMDIVVGSKRGDRGSVAVLREDGKVLAKSGSVFMPFALAFGADDRRVTTIRGQTVIDSTLKGVGEQLAERRTFSTMSVEETVDRYVLRLEIKRPSLFNGVTLERVAFDKETLYPLENDTYEGSVHVQHVVWDHYIASEDLPDKLFTIRYNPERLENTGIRTVANIEISMRERTESRMDDHG